MNKRKLGVLLSVVLMVSLVSCKKSTTPEEKLAAAPAERAASPAAAGGATAKAALEKAREQARAWQADASLQKVMSIYANQGGKVSTDAPLGLMFPWQFIYMSEKTRKSIIVETNAKEVKMSDNPAWSLFLPIAEDFVDSDQAMAEAIRNGYQPDDASPMELTAQYGSKKFPEPTWVIGPIGHEKYCVSAKSGKFIGKESE